MSGQSFPSGSGMNREGALQRLLEEAATPANLARARNLVLCYQEYEDGQSPSKEGKRQEWDLLTSRIELQPDHSRRAGVPTTPIP